MNSFKNRQDWLLLSLAAFLLSIQALLLTMKVASFVHPPTQLSLLGYWLIFFVTGQVAAVVLSHRRLATGQGDKNLQEFLIVEAVLTFFLLSALVKMIFYDYRGEMAQRAFNGLLILAVLNKFCWPKIRQAGNWAYGWINARANAKMVNALIVAGGSVFLALIIFVPNFERVLARMYVGEQFHHLDIFVMTAGWAAYNGHIMDVDQISQYGFGMPYIFAQLTRWMGGFSYANVFLIIMTGTMIYYVLMFWLSLRWFKSAALTLVVMLWGIREQMFHPGDYPFVLTYPSATVIRYFFDIFVMAAIYCHLQRGRSGWLLCAGALSGFAVYYIDSTGVFLLAAYYAYLVCLLMMPYTRSMLYKKRQDALVLGGYFLLPVAVAFVLFYRVAGQHLFTALFWHNFSETVEYFLSGIGTYPIYENFKYHNFFAGLMGLIIPAVWVFTMVFVGAMCYFKRFSRRHIFIIVVCVYGLGVEHYYISRAVLTSYYVTALPFVFVCGWWLKLFLWGWPRRKRNNALMGLVFFTLYALLTNHNFMAYPNVFNWSKNAMIDPLTAQPLPADLSTYFHHLDRNDHADLKLPTNSLGSQDEQLITEKDFATDDDLITYYHQDFDFSNDAHLIQSLTLPGVPVAVISSFETKILMQADRPPFFYYFPLVNSHSKHMRTMPVNFLHTSTERFNSKAIDQLRDIKPTYVFLEKIFLYDFPKAYANRPENIIPIVAFVKENYVPFKMGEYIVVMKHK